MVKTVGKYTLTKKIGKGSYGVVWICSHNDTGEISAMKVVEKEKGDKDPVEREKQKKQLERELLIARGLRHPNVVALKDVVESEHHYYMVMELMEGGELLGQLTHRGGKFTESRARKYFQQLIVGLHHCHENKVAHRDLKLENLLLDKNKNLKISDFGLSNFQSSSCSVLTTVCGTPNYVAPEVLRNCGYDGKRADLWSCGVILFYMVAGRLPFDDPSIHSIYRNIEAVAYTMPEGISSELQHLIRQLLTHDPAQRMTIAQLVADPWFTVGFNPALLQSAAVTVTDEALRSAIEKVERTDSLLMSPSSSDHSPPLPPPPAATLPLPFQSPVPHHLRTDGPADAFDLISRLTAGRLNPLVAGTGSGVAIVKTTNQFLYRGTKENISAVLQGMQCNPKEARDDGVDANSYSTVLDCTIDLPHGPLHFKVLMLSTAAPTLFLVEVRRSSGDAFDLYRIHAQFSASLGHAVRSKAMPSVGIQQAPPQQEQHQYQLTSSAATDPSREPGAKRKLPPLRSPPPQQLTRQPQQQLGSPPGGNNSPPLRPQVSPMPLRTTESQQPPPAVECAPSSNKQSTSLPPIAGEKTK